MEPDFTDKFMIAVSTLLLLVVVQISDHDLFPVDVFHRVVLAHLQGNLDVALKT